MSDTAAVLHAKRDGEKLDTATIAEFVRAVADGAVSDARLGAFAMAVCLRGMDMAEQVALTLAMRDSGQVLSWPGLDGPVLDKHSTGGVGDMVSLILGPLLAACGAYVPMISGRGLGHTGGTLDKLESIPGFDVEPGLDKFRRIVRQAGIAIIGQTRALAPADGRLYAIRDETATVASVPLIVSSILSKKLAEGLDGLVLDVKTGNGAFMTDLDPARELATQLAQVACGAGVPCTAVLTDMNQPLAWSAGNALEVRETIDFLLGERRHSRLEAVVLELGRAALQLSGLHGRAGDAEERLLAELDSGAALERFAAMVSMQGGPADLVDAIDRYLPPAPIRKPLHAGRAGFVQRMATREIGVAVLQLGGGRRRVDDKIDGRVGLSRLCSVGDRLEPDTPLAEIHAASQDDWDRAAAMLRAAVAVGEEMPPLPIIYERIDRTDTGI
jgi:thymidine phosphorylase